MTNRGEKKRRCDLLTGEVDMKRSSKKARNFIKRLDSNPKETHKLPSITPNRIAHHPLMNGKKRWRNLDFVNRELYERKATKRTNLEVRS